MEKLYFNVALLKTLSFDTPRLLLTRKREKLETKFYRKHMIKYSLFLLIIMLLSVCSSYSDEYTDEWFKNKIEEYISYTNKLEKIQFAAEMEKKAKEVSDENIKCHLLNYSGTAYYGAANSMEELSKARDVFIQSLELNSTNDVVVLDSMRQLADLQLGVFQNVPATVALFEEMEKRIKSETNTMHPELKKNYLREMYPKYARAKKMMGKVDESVELREQALNVLSGKEKAEMLLENARQFAANGQKEKAIAGYSRLFKEYPEFGREDGRVINILMEEIGAYGYTNSSDIIPLLIKIWEEPRNQEYLDIFYAGHHLINHLSNARDERLYLYGDEFVARIQNAIKTNTVENIKDKNLELFQDQALARLAFGSVYGPNGPRADAKKRIMEYVNVCPTGSSIKEITDLNLKMERKLTEEESLKAKRWKTRFFAFFVVVIAFIPIFFLSRKKGEPGPSVE